MLASYYNVITNVLNIKCKLRPPLLSNLRILRILKDLISVTVPFI